MYADSPMQKSASYPQRVGIWRIVVCVEDLEERRQLQSSLYVPMHSVAPGTTYIISLSLMNIGINH
jgi:hypothetical protein